MGGRGIRASRSYFIVVCSRSPISVAYWDSFYVCPTAEELLTCPACIWVLRFLRHFPRMLGMRSATSEKRDFGNKIVRGIPSLQTPPPPYFVQIKTDDTIRWTQFAWAKGGRGDLWSSPRPNEYNALIRMERIYKHDMEYLYSQLKCVLSPFNLCTELRAVNCLRILWPGSFTARQTPGTLNVLAVVFRQVRLL